LSFINTLEAARCAEVERFLVVSSACVYPRRSRIPIPEEDGFRAAPEPTNAGYGWSKRMGEFLAGCYRNEYGMNVGMVRPFNAYGPRDDFFHETNHVIPGLITRLHAGESPLTVWGSGKQTRSFLYVTDFARGVLLAGARVEVTGPINLGGDEEVSIGALAKMVVEVSGIDVPVLFDTSKPEGQPRRSCDTRKAKEQLGFQTEVTLRDGLARTIEWYRKEKAFVEDQA
jgi:GDP-L-fucose synthase